MSPSLRTLTRTTGANEALKDGRVRPAGCRLDFVEVDPLVAGFRRMVRALEFDVCEMAVTTYLTAREHGVPFTAIPVPLVRDLHHGAIRTRPELAGADPRRLEGQRVGVNRGYTVTTGVWARAILAREHGIDLDAVTWVLSGDEHVVDYRPPRNVVPMHDGDTLGAMLGRGELSATIGVPAANGRVALLPDPEQQALAAVRTSGFWPVNHVVVVRDDVLAARPGLAPDLFEAFAESKRLWLAGLPTSEAPGDRVYRLVADALGGDPLPYGLAANADMLELLLDAACAQHILRDRPPAAQLFAGDTLGLAG